jgi:O-antigen ligase
VLSQHSIQPLQHTSTPCLVEQLGLAACTFAVSALLLSIPLGAPLRSEVSTALLVLLGAGLILVRYGGFRFHGLLPILLFAAAGIASSALSDFPKQSTARSASGLALLATFFAAQRIVATPWSMRVLRGAASLAVFVLLIDMMAQVWGGSSLLQSRLAPTGHTRFAGSLPNPNEVACIAILAPLSIAGESLMSRGKHRRLALINVVCVTASALLVAFYSGSRATFLGVNAALSMMLWLTRRRAVLGALSVSALLVLCAWIFDLGSVRVRVLDTFAMHDDWRFRVWQVAWHSFLDAPIFGQGPSVFFEVHERARLLPASSGITPAPGGMPWVHCVPLEILTERGLVGFVGAAWIVTTVLRHLRRALSHPKTRPTAVPLASAVAAIAIMSLVDLSLMKDWCIYLFALVGGLCCGSGCGLGCEPSPSDASSTAADTTTSRDETSTTGDESSHSVASKVR